MKDELVPLRVRTTAFSLRVARMYSALPKSRLSETLGYQALRSGTSVGSQYREACRARSNAEIISKLESTLQELDETDYWLELLVGSDVVSEKRLGGLRKEADELTAILVTVVKRIKSRRA
jgi:four helix bundle protein